MNFPRGSAVLVAATVAFLALTGCGDENPQEPRDLLTQETAEEAIGFFAAQQQDTVRSVPGVEAAIDPEFRFHFALEDRTANPEMPEYLEQAAFLAATGNMMALAISIHMEITPVRTLETSACDPDAMGRSCVKYEVAVDMAVEAPTEPENTTLIVEGLAEMTLVQGGDGLWRVREIRDRTQELGVWGHRSAVQNTSWGNVLAFFE